LAAGEIGFESDTNKFKIGTGSTAWASLPYASNISPLTTKGDLYTYSTDNARLAVGANGETLVADSSTSTGLRYTAGTVQTNPVLNSAFQIAQRGTSFSGGASSTYALDRWVMYPNTAMRVSQQSTNDTTNLPFIQYCARVGRVSGNSTTTAVAFDNIFETVNSRPFAGKTVTLSFYARAGANFSGAGNLLPSQLIGGTGTDQNLSTGFTGQTDIISSNATLTTTWQRFTFTASIASTYTQLAIRNYYIPSGTAGANDYYEITGVQLDIGSVALPFRTYAGTIQGELAACQRYYWQTAWNTSAATTIMVAGIGTSSTNVAQAYCAHPVTMRAIPSASLTGTANMFFYNGAGGGSTFAISAIAAQSSTTIAATLNFTSSGTTANVIYNLLAATAGNGFISFSSEL
jgi:hypothetical protein